MGASQSNPVGRAQDHTGRQGTQQRKREKGYGRGYPRNNEATSLRDKRAKARNTRGRSAIGLDGTRVQSKENAARAIRTGSGRRPKTVVRAKSGREGKKQKDKEKKEQKEKEK